MLKRHLSHWRKRSLHVISLPAHAGVFVPTLLVDAITAFQEAAGRIFVAGHLNYSTGGGNINGGTSVSPGRTFLMDL